MHIPDGFIDAPVAIATGAASGVAVAYAVRRTGKELGERTVPLLGVTAAFVFAAQMLNFPIAAGTSGHFLGALLVGVLLGPWASVVVLTAVLAVQALVMADGGITALGANVLNMAVVAGLLGYLCFAGLRALLPKHPTGYFVAVAAAAWFSVVAASAACAIELALSGTVPLDISLAAMTAVHMVIGLGEALITVTVVAAILASRPDLVHTYTLATRGAGRPFGGRGRVWAFVVGTMVLALALAVVVSPFASSAPDGLERVAEDMGFAEEGADSVWSFSPIPDYRIPGVENERAATAIAGLIGTLALFGVVLLVGRALGRRPATGSPQADDAAALHPMGGHEHTDHRHAGHAHEHHHIGESSGAPVDPGHTHT
jgi:cobalt/nickel transport system permease protein